MFDIIVIGFIIFLVIRQSGRISRIEKLLEGKVQNKTVENKEGVASEPLVVATTPQTSARETLVEQKIEPVPDIKIKLDEEASGRFLGKVGIGAVLVGVAFFLKYAFDNNWVGPTGRVMIGILTGVIFLIIGQILRKKYLRYSDMLMGGGIAILYLSVYSAQAFYHLIDPLMAGFFMLIVTVLAFAISIANATMTLAFVGIIGGFATPFLSGVKENNMMMLFGYLMLLNVGVLGVSFFKKWPQIIVVAFIGTAINFLSWYFSFYTESVLASTLFFLFISFVIFLVASIARVVNAGLKADEGDYFLLGMDAFGFAVMSYILLAPNHDEVLGFGAVFIAFIYMLIAYTANKFNPSDRALNIFLPGLAVTFLSIAVPLQFDGPWIAVAWLVEACMLYFISSMISNRGFQIMGIVVYCLGIIDFFIWYISHGLERITDFVPIFNTTFAISIVAVVVAYLIAYMYVKYGSITEEIRDRGIVVFIIVANVLTIFAFTTQVIEYHGAKSAVLREQYELTIRDASLYNTGYDYSDTQSNNANNFYEENESIQNQSNTIVSILWALYAALLTGIGFAKRYAGIRRLGLILFVVTGVKVVMDVWSLGQLYRIISFIVFGIIALIASFAYAKYKDRLKAIIVLVLLLVSGFSFSVTHARFNLEAWQYLRTLSVPMTSDFAKIVLPLDISRTSSNFSDIRIIDQNGNESPYLITRNTSVKGGVVTAQVLNETTLNGSTQFIVDSGEDAVVRTRIALSTSTNNFKRQVGIYSSHTMLPINSPLWALVTDKGYIFKFTDTVTGFSSGKSEIDFSANTARYFKVVIGGGEEGAVDVTGAVLYGDIALITPTYVKTVPATVYNNPSNRTTEVTIDLGVSGYLTHAINLISSDRNYSRKVILESSNDNVTFSRIGEGYISNISTSLFTGSSNRVSYPEQKTRYIRASIVNDDNMPIMINGNLEIEGPVVSAIFEMKQGGTYTLYYGNPAAESSVYDIGRISSYIEENAIPVVSLGEESLNSAYVAPKGPVVPFTESNKWLLNTLLVLVVLILGAGIGMYLRNFKKTNNGFE